MTRLLTRLRSALLTSLGVALAFVSLSAQSTPSRDLFTASNDIGTAQPGSTTFNASTDTYQLRGGGDDVWGTADDFRFTWLKFTGDGSITADLNVAQPPTHAKAKGMLMFRQGLDPGSPYADVALHGDGHIDLQWRLTPGGETRDTDVPQHGATRLRLVRKGDQFTAYALDPSGASHPQSITVPMHGPVYIGLGVCSHSTSELQTVTFSNITIDHGTPSTTSTPSH